jgi:hypothetical protein
MAIPLSQSSTTLKGLTEAYTAEGFARRHDH